MIKIAVCDVVKSGIDIDQTMPMEGVGLSAEELDIRSPLNVKAHIYRADNFIIAETDVTADFGYLCARCLEELVEKETRHYDFEFELEPSTEYVDIGEEVRQELIMANPTRILCKDDCKGICACGANLNVDKCKCKIKGN